MDATDGSLLITSAQAGDAGAYRAVLTSSSGVNTTCSATLPVNPTPIAPSITTQPLDLQVKQGEAASLSVSVTGTPTPSYLWHRNGQPLMVRRGPSRLSRRYSSFMRFSVPEPGPVSLRLFDAAGRLVAVLADGEMASGRSELVFDASGLASGVYAYRLSSASTATVRTMLLLR